VRLTARSVSGVDKQRPGTVLRGIVLARLMPHTMRPGREVSAAAIPPYLVLTSSRRTAGWSYPRLLPLREHSEGGTSIALRNEKARPFLAELYRCKSLFFNSKRETGLEPATFSLGS
jgi:hypothetical protein